MNLHMYVFKRSIHLSCSLAVLRSQTYSNFIASVDQLSIPVLAFSLCSNNNNLWRFFLKMIFLDSEFFVYRISWYNDMFYFSLVTFLHFNFQGMVILGSFSNRIFDIWIFLFLGYPNVLVVRDFHEDISSVLSSFIFGVY